MPMRILTAVALFAMTSFANAAEVSCDVTVVFGSACSGTDVQADRRLVDYLENLRPRPNHKAEPWRNGREGEYNRCIEFAAGTDVDKVIGELRMFIAERGPGPSWSKIHRGMVAR